jgi:hypothetical protein
MADRSHLETLVASMTLSELAAKTGRSLSSIVDFAMSNGRGRSTAPPSASRTPSGSKVTTSRGGGRRSKGIDTRTANGREAYDTAVRRAIEAARAPIGASQIRGKVGGTPQQARAALHRLIEAGTITYTGQARATKYQVS